MTENARPTGLLPRLPRRLLHAGTAGCGHIVVAERFRAPAGLMALRLPTDTLRGRDMGAGETFRVFLVCAGDGTWRRLTVDPASAERHAILDLIFPGFRNADGAMFHLLVTRRRQPGDVRLGLLQTVVLRADLAQQPPIALGCNTEMPGFESLRLRPGPADQMQLAGPPAS